MAKVQNSLICMAVLLVVFIGFIVIAAGRKGSGKRDVSELLEKQSDPFESVSFYNSNGILINIRRSVTVWRAS